MEPMVVYFQVFLVISVVLLGVAPEVWVYSPLLTLRTISKAHMLSYECLTDHTFASLLNI